MLVTRACGGHLDCSQLNRWDEDDENDEDDDGAEGDDEDDEAAEDEEDEEGDDEDDEDEDGKTIGCPKPRVILTSKQDMTGGAGSTLLLIVKNNTRSWSFTWLK